MTNRFIAGLAIAILVTLAIAHYALYPFGYLASALIAYTIGYVIGYVEKVE